MAQTNLEKLGINERNRELTSANYTNTNVYNESHPDALGPNTPNANGDEIGKGTGVAMGYLTPSATKNPLSPINYSTVITDRGGSATDESVRVTHIIRNLYSESNEYGVNSVDTSANVLEGQVVIK